MNAGTTVITSAVRRRSSAAMTVTTDASCVTFELSAPITEESTCWAPCTSVLSRDISAPVWVRTKNPIGIRCTWANNRRRSWNTIPFPRTADCQRARRAKNDRSRIRPMAESESLVNSRMS